MVVLLMFAMILSLQVVTAQDVRKVSLPPVITYGNGQEICPSIEQQNIALQKMKNSVYQYLFNGSILPQCGEGIWYRVAYLNMTDSSQQCPSAWRLYSGSQYRACGRPTSASQSSPATFYITNRPLTIPSLHAPAQANLPTGGATIAIIFMLAFRSKARGALLTWGAFTRRIMHS